MIAHDFSSVGELAVAGKAKVNGEDAAFAYVTDYQTDCLMLSKIAWKGPLGTSVGITSIYLTAGHNLAMSAYEATTTKVFIPFRTSALCGCCVTETCVC